MRQSPVRSIINGGGGNASFMIITIYKSCFNLGISNYFHKTISKKNMTRMNKITWHKTSQNALMKLHTIICEQ